MRPFVPLFRNPHIATVAGHLWRRPVRPATTEIYRTDPETQVRVEEEFPEGRPRGHVVLVHGLESSAEAGYMRGQAAALVEAGWAVHRLNLRSCGGTERLCRTAYHSGLTCDLRALILQLPAPVFVVGFSLGGNVALKLAGEMGEAAVGRIGGVCGVSVPIDLAACTARLEHPRNRFYEQRFLRKLRKRMRLRHELLPDAFPVDGLEGLESIRAFDDWFTAPAFGFRDAADYYYTQSAVRFFDGLRVPVLLIQSKDDPMVPFEIFETPAVRANPRIEVLATEHGGHIGFIARRRPRFWNEEAAAGWITSRT